MIVRAAMVMPVSMVPEGAVVEIVSFSQRSGRGFMQKLFSIGIYPGAVIRVLRNQFPGPLIVDVMGTRIMLGYGMANRIYVRIIG